MCTRYPTPPTSTSTWLGRLSASVPRSCAITGSSPGSRLWRRAARVSTRASQLIVPVQVDGIDYADDGGVDGRGGAADGGHCGKAFGGEQDALADSCVHGV